MKNPIKLRQELYNAVYRLFNEMDYSLTINVGPLTMSLYDPEENRDVITPTIWEKGVRVNGEVFTVGATYGIGYGPGTYAQLFAGEYDIIEGLTELIWRDINE